MAEQTLTRVDLRNALMREAGVAEDDAPHLLESVLSHISDALVNGENVKIPTFGTFSVRDKPARTGRNLKTGEAVPIPPRRVLTFRPSDLMRQRVAEGNKS